MDVLLVDRAPLPSDIPHGHFGHRDGPERLARWGLLDRVLAPNCPPVTSMTSDFGDVSLTGHDLIVDGVPLGLAPRRDRLDAVLVEAAVQAGAELRDRFAVLRYGATQLPNYLRSAHGSGWALVGDAGCHKDPFVALGICDALRDAELLSATLTGRPVGPPVEEALAGYERQRNAATLPDYHQTWRERASSRCPSRTCGCARR